MASNSSEDAFSAVFMLQKQRERKWRYSTAWSEALKMLADFHPLIPELKTWLLFFLLFLLSKQKSKSSAENAKHLHMGNPPPKTNRKLQTEDHVIKTHCLISLYVLIHPKKTIILYPIFRGTFLSSFNHTVCAQWPLVWSSIQRHGLLCITFFPFFFSFSHLFQLILELIHVFKGQCFYPPSCRLFSYIFLYHTSYKLFHVLKHIWSHDRDFSSDWVRINKKPECIFN